VMAIFARAGGRSTLNLASSTVQRPAERAGDAKGSCHVGGNLVLRQVCDMSRMLDQQLGDRCSAEIMTSALCVSCCSSLILRDITLILAA
jgi:hypothetical protein